MKFPLDDRPMLKMTIDVVTILFALVAVLAGKNKEAENAALGRVEIAVQAYHGTYKYAHGLKGQLEEAEDDLEHYAKEGEKFRGIIETLEKDLGVMGEQLGEQQEELNRLRPGGPVDIVITVDCTMSMDPHHERLKKALITLFKWTPRLSSRLLRWQSSAERSPARR